MKKLFKLFILLSIFLSFTFVGIKASADTGPKPFVKISVNGECEGMYMTLLSKNEHSGPWSKDNSYTKNDGKLENAELKFSNYVDSDNFNYLHFIDSIEDHEFKWTYYPPQTFKILIYDSINDKLLTNNQIYERYQFASTYRVLINNDKINMMIENEPEKIVNDTIVSDQAYQVIKEPNQGNEIGNFFIRLLICLTIEMIIAVIFGFRRFELLLIFGTNVLTQVLLNIGLNAFVHFNGFNVLGLIPIYVLLEFAVLLIEFAIYAIFMYKIEKKKEMNYKSVTRILLYTLTANVASLLLGFWILSYITL